MIDLERIFPDFVVVEQTPFKIELRHRNSGRHAGVMTYGREPLSSAAGRELVYAAHKRRQEYRRDRLWAATGDKTRYEACRDEMRRRGYLM